MYEVPNEPYLLLSLLLISEARRAGAQGGGEGQASQQEGAALDSDSVHVC